MSDETHTAASSDNEAPRRSNTELLQKALELAPKFESLAQVGRAVNEALDIDLTDATWRGIYNRNDSEREQVRKLLGTEAQAQRRQREIRIDGNVRGVVTSDVHVPFHDPNAVVLAAKLIRHYDPDISVYAGDHLDFYAVSTYDRNPGRVFRIQDEIDQWHVDVLAPWGGASKRARKIFIPGNHEDRLRRYLWRHPELFGLKVLELPNLLELDRLDIEYAELAVNFGGVLEVSHGTKVSKWSGATAKAEQELRGFSISTITGHVHRAGTFAHFGHTGQENPCLCDLNPEYVRNPAWTQGLTFFEIRDGIVKIEPVKFTKEYTAIYAGKLFRA